MLGVIEGFAIVLIIAAVGYVFAAVRRGRGTDPQAALTSVIYYVTNPALMFILLAEAPVEEVLRTFAPAALLIAAVCGAVYAGVSLLFFRRSAADTAVGAMSSSYANAGNIGLPIALYAVGSSTPVVSVLVAQLLVVAPLYLAVFSFTQRRAASGRSASGPGALAAGPRPRARPLALLTAVVRPFANPVTLATLAGLAAALSGFRLPGVLWEPVSLLGHASVPLLLLTFGMSLHGQRPLGTAAVRTEVLVAAAVKLLVAPLLGYAVGRWVFGLDGVDLFGVVVMSALPTAQNVYLFSHQFGMKSVIARDVIFLTSFLSFPVILFAALLLA
ncbi:AEC family transporter [Arthrobacter sp. zg-Y1219]|uniref:AEC family transporter n=1 Tax=Arthrobacter sp. zg-Y1219 TaxID=3049067 RepID=UPI0024C471BD|nr:AEC family transporter [Arthrobacter sp. zg-Y1219]MDK1361265.1 AEC family transporter [Arthrobacter sp. zg-Y1219]